MVCQLALTRPLNGERDLHGRRDTTAVTHEFLRPTVGRLKYGKLRTAGCDGRHISGDGKDG